MKRPKLSSVFMLLAQVFVWALLISAPAAISYIFNPDGSSHWPFLFLSLVMIMPSTLIYFISFYLLIPYLFFRGRKLIYFAVLVALVLLANFNFFHLDLSTLGDLERVGIYSTMIVSSLCCMLSSFAALSIRSFIRTGELRMQLIEAQRKNAEAELHWLKNQLNPHFLFNSLNNISSLTQIDPDQAQEAIMQLSDMLRYALYESNKPLVPLADEAEFMQNYVSMMRLRYSDSTKIEADFVTGSGQPLVAPLLFISFVENAFKHGVSNSQPSYVGIRLEVSADGQLTFTCRNTNFPKPATDRSGSGIGLENTRRRLDLLYPDRYAWHQQLCDNIYEVTITIKL